jgi:hypothetical protein
MAIYRIHFFKETIEESPQRQINSERLLVVWFGRM